MWTWISMDTEDFKPVQLLMSEFLERPRFKPSDRWEWCVSSAVSITAVDALRREERVWTHPGRGAIEEEFDVTVLKIARLAAKLFFCTDALFTSLPRPR